MNEPQMVNHKATGIEAADAHPLGAAGGYAAALADAIGHLAKLKASGSCSISHGPLIQDEILMLTKRLRELEPHIKALAGTDSTR